MTTVRSNDDRRIIDERGQRLTPRERFSVAVNDIQNPGLFPSLVPVKRKRLQDVLTTDQTHRNQPSNPGLYPEAMARSIARKRRRPASLPRPV